MGFLPDLTLRVKAEPADEITARLLGVASAPWPPPREGGTCGCGDDDDAPVLRLPDYMAQDGNVQVARIGAEWSEVFPGLEAVIFAPADDKGQVTVQFRLSVAAGEP